MRSAPHAYDFLPDKSIYKKQRLDRDDVVDITDFNVAAWLKKEMVSINEEIASDPLGDGRTESDPDKVNEEAIRADHHENELSDLIAFWSSPTTDETPVDDIVLACGSEGSGSPTLPIDKKRKVQRSRRTRTAAVSMKPESSLAAAMGVSKIVTVPGRCGLEHQVKGVNTELLAIVVDLRDHTIGSERRR